MTSLSYGTPPALEDCTEIGTVPLDVVPKKIENQGVFAGQLELANLYGLEVPDRRRAWMTVAYYRHLDVPLPYAVKVPKFGILVYDRTEQGESWAVLN